MTTPNSNDPKPNEGTARFRAIMDAQGEEKMPEPPPQRSILDLLPKAAKSKGPDASAAAPQAQPQPQPAKAAPPKKKAGLNFSFPSAKKAAPRPQPRPQPAVESAAQVGAGSGSGTKRQFGPAYWTVTGTISLIVNAILFVIVFVLILQVARLRIKVTELTKYTSLPLTTVSGLYTNFELMDRAHIRTQIPINTQIPVQFELQISQQTEVTLSQDTPINGARVTLTTGGLNITNAPANIILPAGTRLPILLALVVPVDKQVPVSMIVPVDIALANTELSAPFKGLQTTIQPIYCLLKPNAASLDGAPICTK